jgi:hypothetical protein
MDRHHRANLIPFLRRNVSTLYARTMLAHSAETVGCRYDDERHAVDLRWGWRGGEIPEDWLEQTPLMRRLTELEAGRPFLERKATAVRNALYEAATGYRKVRL